MEMGEEEANEPPKSLEIHETLEDRISDLPDCIILQILSLLPSTKDAITTGTLSKRWKSLWTLIPTLVFKQLSLNQPTSDFVTFVNETLAQCPHSKLNTFEISFEYAMRFEPQVNIWIRYAITCNVEELKLTLFNCDNVDRCALEEQFFVNSCFTHLKLQGCIFDPKGAISWKLLRSLCICYASLDEDLIENMLSGSPLLETLELNFCYGYRRLQITSKSIKNLVFRGYRYLGRGEVIEIKAPNILSLKILNSLILWKLLLVDVSSLIEVELNYTKIGYYCHETALKESKELLKGLIQSLRHVKELKVGYYCAKVLSCLEAEGFPFPSNMKLPRDYFTKFG